MNRKLKELSRLKKLIQSGKLNNEKDLLMALVQEKETILKLEDHKNQLLSERKYITILFADISGFTAMSELLDPEQVKTLLNNCFDCLVPIIEKHGGYIDKFIGDEIMALFGAPISQENFTSSSLMAALEMMEELQEFNKNKKIKLEMHIGINTGLVVTGGLGSKGKLHYTVIGDTVNVASRMESLANNGEIIVGEETYLKTKEEFDFKAIPKLQVKGKQKWVQPYILKEKKTNKQNTLNDEPITEILLGRKNELSSCKLYIKQCYTQKQSAILSISGEAGIGKSSFVKAILKENFGDLKWVVIKIHSFQKSHNFALIKNLILEFLGLENHFNQSDLKAKLSEKLPKLSADKINHSYIFLALLFNFPLKLEEQNYVNNQNSNYAKISIENSLINILNAYGTKQNTCLILEDISWLDEASYGVLKGILQRGNSLKLGVILVDRNEKLIGELLLNRPSKNIILKGLSKQKAHLLLNAHFKIELKDKKLGENILKMAGGNPLYLKELATYYTSLKNQNTALKDSFRNTSNNLQHLLITKLDQLGKFQKNIIQTASIMGNEFKEDLLLDLLVKCGYKRIESNKTIQSLIALRIFEPSLNGYIQFKSSVYADVAYQNLLKSRRIYLHKTYAQLLIKEAKKEQNKLSFEIANHLELADKNIDAIPYLIENINFTLKFGSNTEAYELINRLLYMLENAIKLKKEIPKHKKLFAQYLEKKASCLVKMSQIEEAVKLYQYLINITTRSQKLDIINYHIQISFAYKIIRRGNQIKEHANVALNLLKEHTDKRSKVWKHYFIEANNALMWGYYFNQEIKDLMKRLASTESICIKYGNYMQKTDMYYAQVAAHLMQSNYANIKNKTLLITENGIKEAKLSNNKMLLALKYSESGFVYTWTKHEDKAKEYFLTSIQLSEECYYIEPWITSLNYLGYLFRKNKDAKNLRKHLKVAIRLVDQYNYHYLCPIYGTLLSLKLDQNQLKSSANTARTIEVQEMKLPGNYPLKFMFLGPLFRYYLTMEDFAKAANCLNKTIELGQKKWSVEFTNLIKMAVQAYNQIDIDSFKEYSNQVITYNTQKRLGYC